MKCNVAYKKGKKLDIYQPTKIVYEKTPVLVYFHGGGWVFGSKKAVNFTRFNIAFNQLREQGYAIISPSYTLAKSGKSPFPACLIDANDAISWVEKNAQKYNFDINNIGVMGESAGAHIGMMASYDGLSDFTKTHSLSINYMINIYGPTDLFQLYKDLTPLLNGISKRVENMPSIFQKRFNVVENLFGFNPKEDHLRAEEFAVQFSPYHKITPESPNTLIIHGDRDQLVPVSQSLILKDRLDVLGVTSIIKIFKGVGHSLRGASAMQRLAIQEHVTTFALQHYSI
jgi:acetyl esterase/lipase